VLAREPEPRGRTMLEEAIGSGRGQRIRLLRPLPVYILYWTAFAGENGTLQFREDVYGRDRRPSAAADTEDLPSPPGPGARGCETPGEEAVP
jgi:murein L,D-transpeptidase YcbB/YkuD